LREFVRKYLPGFEPTLAAAATVLVGYAVVFIGGYPFETVAPVQYFCFIVPWLIFTAGWLGLSHLMSQPLSDGYLYFILPMSLFLVVAGAWIYRTEHDWADAVYVPFIFLCVIGNLAVVCWCAAILFRWWRGR
jgi:hypothetical protein